MRCRSCAFAPRRCKTRSLPASVRWRRSWAPTMRPLSRPVAKRRRGEVVEPVNFNAPGQLVIAGNKAAVERAIAVGEARGAKRGVMLPVSAPFHSSLLKRAAERLAQRLARVNILSPAIAVLHNVDVAEDPAPDAIRAALARQAASPVRWAETIRAFAARGVTHVIECGPGKVLSGLVRRIDENLTTFALNDRASIDEALAAIQAA